MRRTRYQQGSLKLASRKNGKVWEFRWREVQLDGKIRRKNIVNGTLDEYPSEAAAQSAADSIRLTINRQTPTQALKQNVAQEVIGCLESFFLARTESIAKAPKPSR